MAIKYGIIGGLALLAEQARGLSWKIDDKALVKGRLPFFMAYIYATSY
jgi:hypothetical protein